MVESTESAVVTSYVPEPIAERIDEYAEREDLTRSKAISEILKGSVTERIFQSKVIEVINKVTNPNVRAFRLSVVTDDGLETVTAAKGGEDELDRNIDLATADVALIREHAMRADASFEETLEFYKEINDEKEWSSVMVEGDE